VGLFYQRAADLGVFEEVQVDKMPAGYRQLLAHQNHMTVTVEQFHGSPVDVRVLEARLTGQHYVRKILLARQSDGQVVQFGIVRLNLGCVSPEVRHKIESQSAPLGRIMIEHNILREIHLVKLWRITPGDDLRRLFGLASGQLTYGRTALIDFGGQPAVELLEIVTPVPS